MHFTHFSIVSLSFLIFYNELPIVNSEKILQRCKRVSGDPNNAAVVPQSTGPILRALDEELAFCGSSKIDIREVTIIQLQNYFQCGQLSSLKLSACYLNRISKLNPYLKAVIEVNSDALRIAFKTDLERMLGIIRSPMHGIPILVKDNMATLDMMQTTAGAIAMEYLKPKKDAGVVTKLRDAGAVILGKSNPAEWAFFRGTNIPSGWSGRGGQTLCPYVLTSDPSESSVRSAVAVAANLIAVALGTETDGSITSPAGRNSLVGLKPTLEAVSTEGVIPISFSQDTVGPLTRTVSDAKILFDVISAKDSHKDNSDLLSNKTFRVGVVRDPFWNASDSTLKKTIPVLEEALKALQKSGNATILDPISGNPDVLSKVTKETEFTILRHEFKYGVNEYLKKDVYHLEFLLGRRIQSLADIIRFNKENPSPEGNNQDELLNSEATDGLNNQTYIKLRDENKQNAQEYILKTLEGNNLDALAAPCDTFDTWWLYSIGSIAGYPSIAVGNRFLPFYSSVPVGVTDEGIQFGICFTGRPHSERVLLKIAALLEQVYSGRMKPNFKI